MTVSSEVRETFLVANDSTRDWPFPWRVYDAGHVRLAVRAPGETVYSVVSGTVVLGAGNARDGFAGGTVSYPAEPAEPLATGYSIRIDGVVPHTQTGVDLTNASGFDPVAVEREFDLTTMKLQQMRDGVIAGATTRAEAAEFAAEVARQAAEVAQIAAELSLSTIQTIIGPTGPTPPTNPVPGMLWYDGQLIRVYDGNEGTWLPAVSAALGGIAFESGTFGAAPDGEIEIPSPNFLYVLVYLNGLLLRETDDYTIDGNTITILDPAEDDEWFVWIYRALDATDYYTKEEVDGLARVFDDVAALEAMSFAGDPPAQVRVGTSFYLYRNSTEPSHPMKVQDADGSWWELAPIMPLRVTQFGVVGDGVTDDAAAWANLAAYGEALYDAGYRGISIDLEGLTVGLATGITFGDKWNEAVVQNGGFKAVGTWSNLTSGAIFAFFSPIQTVTADGKTWVVRDPLVSISGFNPGFRLVNITIDGDRKSAGLYVSGASKRRGMYDCLVQNCRTYQVFMDETFEGINSRIRGELVGNGERDAYGLVYNTNDTKIEGWTIQWCHCPLLVTGATLYMDGCDLFNGSNTEGSPITSRLIEYRGNTCTWSGGRLGNGQIHVWNTDLTIFGTKFGYTNTNDGDAVFVFYSTSLNQQITNFMLYPAELPIELRNGSVKLIDLRSGAGNSWAATAAHVESWFAYVFHVPNMLRLIAGAGDTVVQRLISTGVSSYVEFENSGNWNGNRPAVGAAGETLRLKAGTIDRWELVNNGVLRPVIDASYAIGSAALAPSEVFAHNARLLNPHMSSGAAPSKGLWVDGSGFVRWKS